MKRFIEYINKSTLRTSSKQDYALALLSVKQYIDGNKSLNCLITKILHLFVMKCLKPYQLQELYVVFSLEQKLKPTCLE